MSVEQHLTFAVLISANREWRAVKALFPKAVLSVSPFGEYFFANAATADDEPILFFQGGWGKVAAAASTQYVIDHFNPGQLINLGTCGGIEGRVHRFDIVAAEKVVIYDIYQAMGEDPLLGVSHYTTEIDLPADFPIPLIRTTLYSADRDVTAKGLRDLDRLYQPVAVDWESGAIAWVARRNRTPVLILRGVSDLISPEQAEAEGNEALWEENAARMMEVLIRELPKFIRMNKAAKSCE